MSSFELAPTVIIATKDYFQDLELDTQIGQLRAEIKQNPPTEKAQVMEMGSDWTPQGVLIWLGAIGGGLTLSFFMAADRARMRKRRRERQAQQTGDVDTDNADFYEHTGDK
jgi:hypothetical protein